MKNVEDYRQLVNLTLDFDNQLAEIPIDIPCHAYALGILYDYCIGEFLGTTVDSNTSDFDFIDILTRELELMNLKLQELDSSELSKVIGTKRVVLITRMDTPCRDYHFYLYRPDGTFSHKFRYSEPQYSSTIELIRCEYSLGLYSIERAL